MTNREIYSGYLTKLQQVYSANEAAVITDWVFESVAGLHRADIIKNPGHLPNTEMAVHLENCLHALLRHKPVQYVLGEAWFCKMKFKVNEQALIPRPETEELVQLVVDGWKPEVGQQHSAASVQQSKEENQSMETPRGLSMLDIGTGSGCIAIALKKFLPAIRMYAIDVSPGALSVAKENAIALQADIRFLQLDFLDENSWEGLPVLDAIISNPPYIPLHEKEKMDKNVTAFEPHAALFVPDDKPLLFYEKIAAFGKIHLDVNGKIYVEIHEGLAQKTAAVFSANYGRVEIIKDIFGKERMIVAANA